MATTLEKIKDAIGSRKEVTFKVLIDVFNALNEPVDVFENDFDHRIMGILLTRRDLFLYNRLADKRKFEIKYPGATFCGSPRSEEEILEIFNGTFEQNWRKYASLSLSNEAERTKNIDRHMTARRQQLELNETHAEKIFRNELQSREIPFSFQKRIGLIIVDFLVGNTVVEIDGGYHSTAKQQQADKERDEKLKNMGYNVMRFSNDEILANVAEAAKKVLHTSGL